MHKNVREKKKSITNAHWPLALCCETPCNHESHTQHTHAALAEPPLETDPALRARQHIYAKGLYYMEPAAFHSNKRNLTCWRVELMQSRCVVMSS